MLRWLLKIRLLSVLLVCFAFIQTVEAQRGPSPVVAKRAKLRNDEPLKKIFVATVHPLRKSIVGSAVDGRVEYFLAHSTSVSVVEQSDDRFVAQIVRLSQVTAEGKTADEAVTNVATALAGVVQQFRKSEQAIPWEKKAELAPGSARWVPYNYDDTKLVRVKKGQPLAALRVGTARILIDGAKAQRDLRQAEFDEATKTLNDRLAQADARVKSAVAQKDYANARFERYRSLNHDGRSRTISLDEFELARAKAIQAESAVKDAQVTYKLIEQKYDIQQAKAQLDVADSEYLRQQDRLAKFVIRAPFDGYVVVEHTEVGAWIKSGDPVAEVVQLDPIEVRVHVPEVYAAKIRVGSKAQVNVTAVPGKAFTGDVTSIVAEAETRSRTFPVKVQVKNPDHQLRGGMLAHVELEISAPRCVMVPKDALVLGKEPRGTGERVYVADPVTEDAKTMTARAVVVQTGISEGGWIEVAGDVKEGELVVIAGNERLQPGDALKVEIEQ